MTLPELIKALQSLEVDDGKPVVMSFDHFNKYGLTEMNFSIHNNQLFIHPIADQTPVLNPIHTPEPEAA